MKTMASECGFVQKREVEIPCGIIDYVWYFPLKKLLPGLPAMLPIVGNEVETSWRTRKHIKGDMLNLLQLRPAIGVVLFLREGFKSHKDFDGCVDAARRFAAPLTGISQIAIWTSFDLEKSNS